MNNLEDWNKDRAKAIFDANAPGPNGIACPACNAELWDTNPMMILASNPPQLNVHCPKCGFKSYRIK